MYINLNFKYARIQGKELAVNTLQGKGIFSICMELLRNDVMEEEDADLYREIDDWFVHNLPWPLQCKNQESVVCWFKTKTSAEMMKMIKPVLWLLDRYEHPYYLVFTNSPGEIVYEDEYQIVTKAGEALKIEPIPASWSTDDDAQE